MARGQSQGGSRGRKGPSRKPKGKVGSDSGAAKGVGGKGDFGVPENDTINRTYTSSNTRASDRGAAQPHAGEGEGRVAGVGGNASGRGSSSGGDLDTDIIGVGTGGSGISQSGGGQPPGPDDSDGTAREFASGRGAAAVSRPPRPDPDALDDSFAGEVSQDEAAGQDSH